MKTLKKYFVFIAIALSSFGFSQQSNQKIEMNIDRIGNAKITLSMTMNAQQWQTWNTNYGNNPSALKRDVERGMPAFFVDDFKLEKDDMNRSFKLSFNGYGVCEIDKRGRWIVDTDQKKANATELTDHKYMLVSSPPELGGNVQQTYIIEFPKEAEDIKIDTDSFGKSIFKFEMDRPSSGFNILRWAGIVFVLAGGGLYGKTKLNVKGD